MKCVCTRRIDLSMTFLGMCLILSKAEGITSASGSPVSRMLLPTLNLTCYMNNCGSLADVRYLTQDVTYVLECRSQCKMYSPQMNKFWKLRHRSSFSTDWTDMRIHGLALVKLLYESIQFKRGFFRTPGIYELSVRITLTEQPWTALSAKTQFTIYAAPSGGSCTISPPAGHFLNTVFTLNCSGWQSQVVRNKTLMFAYGFLLKDDVIFFPLFSTDTGSASATSLLRPGHETNNFIIEVKFCVSDVNNQSLCQIHYADVQPPHMENFQFSDNIVSSVTIPTSLGDLQEILQLTFVTEYMVDYGGDDLVTKPYNLVHQMETYLNTSQNSEIIKFPDLYRNIQVLVHIESFRGVDVPDWQWHLRYLLRESQNVADFIANNIEYLNVDDTIGLSQKFLNLACLSVGLAANVSLENIHDVDLFSEEWRFLEEFGKEIINLVEDLCITLTYKSQAGGPPLVVETGEVSIYVQKIWSYEISDLIIKTRHGRLSFQSLTYEDVKTSCVTIQTIFFKSPSVFQRQNSDSIGMAQFKAIRCSHHLPSDVFLMDLLAKRYIVELNPLIEMENVPWRSSVPVSSADLNYHSVDAKDTENMVAIVKTQADLEMFVGHDYEPSINDYTFVSSVPYSTQPTIIKIGNTNTTQIKRIFIGIASKFGNAVENFTLRYQIALGSLTCMQRKSSVWSQLHGCYISVARDNNFPLVAKPLQFGLTFVHFERTNNPLQLQARTPTHVQLRRYSANSFIAVGVVVLWISVMFWVASMKDIDDREHWELIQLAENSTSHKYMYELHVYTSSDAQASQDLEVQVKISNDKNSSPWRLLQTNDYETVEFAAGSIQAFLLTSGVQLEHPNALTLQVKNLVGSEEAKWWKLDMIVFVDLQTQTWQLFHLEEQISVEGTAESTTNVKIPVATDISDFATSGHKVHAVFDETHIWMSVVSPKVKSTFSRFQRHACCSVKLCGILLGSKFYRSTPLIGRPNLLFAFVTLVHPLLVSIIVAGLVVLFTKCRITKSEAEEHFISYAPLDQCKSETKLLSPSYRRIGFVLCAIICTVCLVAFLFMYSHLSYWEHLFPAALAVDIAVLEPARSLCISWFIYHRLRPELWIFNTYFYNPVIA